MKITIHDTEQGSIKPFKDSVVSEIRHKIYNLNKDEFFKVDFEGQNIKLIDFQKKISSICCIYQSKVSNSKKFSVRQLNENTVGVFRVL